MSATVFCSKCATWRELFAPCACPRPKAAPASASNMWRAVHVAASLASDRLRSGRGPFAVTEAEMLEASGIATTTVEA